MLPIIIIIACIFAFIAVLLIFFKPWEKSGRQQKYSGYNKKPAASKKRTFSSSLPKERVELTSYLKKNYAKIEQAKRMTRNSQMFSQETAAWLEQFGWQVTRVGLLTKELTLEEKFAAIFLVNHIFHKYNNNQAEETKNFLQRTIILHHNGKVGWRIIQHRGSEMLELFCGVFTTHLPEHVAKSGKILSKQEAYALGPDKKTTTSRKK